MSSVGCQLRSRLRERAVIEKTRQRRTQQNTHCSFLTSTSVHKAQASAHTGVYMLSTLHILSLSHTTKRKKTYIQPCVNDSSMKSIKYMLCEFDGVYHRFQFYSENDRCAYEQREFSQGELKMFIWKANRTSAKTEAKKYGWTHFFWLPSSCRHVQTPW